MTTEKFVAKLRATPWYKKNGEAVRQYQLLKATDPASLAARRAALTAQIQDSAGQMGAVIPGKQLLSIVENALMFNWNDAQLKNAMQGFVKAYNGVYNGQAGSDVASLRQTAWRNGVNLSEATIQSMAQQIAKGTVTVGYYNQYIRNQAKSLAPGFAAELDGGRTCTTSPDPTSRPRRRFWRPTPPTSTCSMTTFAGLSPGPPRTGKPSSMTLWQFEQKMRQNPAWLKTQSAQDSVMGEASKVLKDMGMMG